MRLRRNKAGADHQDRNNGTDLLTAGDLHDPAMIAEGKAPLHVVDRSLGY